MSFIGNRRALASSDGGWWAGSAFRAIDAADGASKQPAAIADFRNWRFAITQVPAGQIASASVEQLSRLRSCTFTEWFSFTSGGGTYIDSAGVMQTAPANTPRVDFSTGIGRLALNNAATNICLSSDDPTQGGVGKWNPDGGVFSLVSGVGRFTQPVIGGMRFPRAAAAISSSTTYTISADVRSFGSDGSSLSFAGWNGSAWVVGPALTLSASWQRLSYTFTTGTMTSQEGTGWRHGGGVGTGFEFRRVQIEASSFASPYIPTTASAVTRPIETCQFGAAATAIMQRSAASVVVRGQLAGPSSAGVLRKIIGTDTTLHLLSTEGSNTLISAWNGTGALTSSIGSVLSSFGAGVGFDANGRGLSGGAATNTDAASVGSRSAVYLARGGAVVGTNPGYADGFYDYLALYPFRVSNAELQRLAVPA